MFSVTWSSTVHTKGLVGEKLVRMISGEQLATI